MNIKAAKEEICRTVRTYLRKDAVGDYVFPTVRQRPILLMGPPGIGKTAILEQIAGECGVGLVSYALTHHTRQSVIGLPHIERRNLAGQELDVTEYTMSEIVASVYRCMERTGGREGILFLDEINCVSQTLEPTMLQLLQNKTFGSHRVPEGWVIVAAGNPPEFNRSVRAFDIVTLDRVRQIRIEPDCEVWMEYAWAHGVHGAVLSYLAIHPNHFYLAREGEEGSEFVTARGWEDLSELLKGYEADSYLADTDTISQYLQNEEVASDFASHYRLYRKYGADYGIADILSGRADEDTYGRKVRMAGQGGFDERLMAAHFVLDYLHTRFAAYCEADGRTAMLYQALLRLREFEAPRTGTDRTDGSDQERFNAFLQSRREALAAGLRAEPLSAEDEKNEKWVIRKLRDYGVRLREERILRREEGFARMQEFFQEERSLRSDLVGEILEELERAFRFVLDSFEDGQELLLLVSGLTQDPKAAEFLSMHPCEPYLRYSERLLFRKEENELQRQCEAALSRIAPT